MDKLESLFIEESDNIANLMGSMCIFVLEVIRMGNPQYCAMVADIIAAKVMYSMERICEVYKIDMNHAIKTMNLPTKEEATPTEDTEQVSLKDTILRLFEEEIS